MRVRVFQLPDGDKRLYQSYEKTVANQGFDRSAYLEVYDSEYDEDIRLKHWGKEIADKVRLEDMFIAFNPDDTKDLPKGYTGHTLSISDLVEITREGKTETYYCEPVGWRLLNEKNLGLVDERIIVLYDDDDKKVLVKTNASSDEILDAIRYKDFKLDIHDINFLSDFEEVKSYLSRRGYIFESVGIEEELEKFYL